VHQPSDAGVQSSEYHPRENPERAEEREWTRDGKNPRANSFFDPPEIEQHAEAIALIAETKASDVSIPRSYEQAMSIDSERWLAAMRSEMEMLKTKHTLELVKPPPGARIMDPKWVYDVKWDGEGSRFKDTATLVRKGYTLQLGVDVNEIWAAVTL
jgi:hypothetical protein